ncbi:MAG: DNA-directed RNA polymerase subunit omega [Candidatus Omnitrophica bacterium]|nr:DNA-directed RNA polymerase subunit omega [Candidatus Omnitrophota bacterium]
MAYVSLEKMIKKNPSLFKLVLVAAERANQLVEGSKALVQSASKKMSTVALEEIREGKVYYEAPKEDE